MWGEFRQWDPWAYVRERHPDVQVVEMDLPGRLQGCVDHQRRIIWLARELNEVQRVCTLAYELGQLEQGPTPEDPCLARARQQAAQEWAACRLISSRRLLEGFALSFDLPTIAAFLGVDVPTLRTRVRGMTDEEQDCAMAALSELRQSAA